MVRSLAAELRPELTAALAANSDVKYSTAKAGRARRALKNTALGYLSSLQARRAALWLRIAGPNRKMELCGGFVWCV